MRAMRGWWAARCKSVHFTITPSTRMRTTVPSSNGSMWMSDAPVVEARCTSELSSRMMGASSSPATVMSMASSSPAAVPVKVSLAERAALRAEISA